MQLAVIGYAQDSCTPEAYELAYRVGREIAKQGAVLITGGLGGVMEAASRGAQEAGGLAVGIVPQDDASAANAYTDVVVATGIGYARDFLTAYSADGIVIIGGGAGTFIEACAGYLKRKPMIALVGSGGTADEVADRSLDERRLTQIVGVREPEEAVRRLLAMVSQPSTSS